ncbi:hypothetical protein KY284_008204 [Solanum tuberosum]|nr:hypothetical protein KY284_008204 [Solanum tuberosum]
MSTTQYVGQADASNNATIYVGYNSLGHPPPSKHNRTPIWLRWQPPRSNTFKINIDAASNPHNSTLEEWFLCQLDSPQGEDAYMETNGVADSLAKKVTVMEADQLEFYHWRLILSSTLSTSTTSYNRPSKPMCMTYDPLPCTTTTTTT